jgi:hypothetical protein
VAEGRLPVKLALTAALVIPLSFWDSFDDTIPRLICETPYFVHHRVVVMPKQFVPENLIRIARAFAEASANVPLAVLYMAPRYDVVTTYVVTGKSSNFENWRYRIELDLKSGWEPVKDIAQVNVVSGEAVLRLRKDGRVSRYPLSGRDPLKYTIDGQTFEILEIYGDLMGLDVKTEYLDGGMLPIRTCVDCVPYFHVAVRTSGELRMPTFRELVKRLAQIDVPADLSISLRQDTWFVPSGTFPLLYAFDEPTPKLPSKEEYESAKELGALVNRKSRMIYFDEYISRKRIDRGSEQIQQE